MRRRSYRYRPNKVQSAVGIAAGGLFILLGLFFVIPTFGFFGIIWTLFAVGITASNAYAAFSGKGYGSLEMEERDGPGEGSGGFYDSMGGGGCQGRMDAAGRAAFG